MGLDVVLDLQVRSKVSCPCFGSKKVLILHIVLTNVGEDVLDDFEVGERENIVGSKVESSFLKLYMSVLMRFYFLVREAAASRAVKAGGSRQRTTSASNRAALIASSAVQ